MNTLETSKAARKLITTPENWTQGEYARDAKGKGLFRAQDASAVCWCAQGAIRKVYGEESDNLPAIGALKSVVDFPWSFTSFNDGHTHAEVLAAFDEAIAKAEATNEPQGV